MSDLKARTRRFAVAAIRFCETLPPTSACRIISRQLMRSATSVGANHRAACRAQSSAAFLAKRAIVEEEADECGYGLELLADLGVGAILTRDALHAEADELTAIVVASKKTARRPRKKT